MRLELGNFPNSRPEGLKVADSKMFGLSELVVMYRQTLNPQILDPKPTIWEFKDSRWGRKDCGLKVRQCMRHFEFLGPEPCRASGALNPKS